MSTPDTIILDQTIVGSAADDIFESGDGNDNLRGEAGNDWLHGGAGRDELIGGSGSDTLIGGSGRDILSGGGGNDVYIFDRDSQHDEIYDSFGNDTVRIEGLPAEVTLEKLGQYLFIRLGGSGLAIREYFGETDAGRIENIVFADGTVWHRDEVLKALEGQTTPPPPEGKVIVGTDADDILAGTGGHDTIDGGLGRDSLYGGSGNDTYIFGPQSGMDEIHDIYGTDSIRIDALPADVAFSATEDNSYLYIHVGASRLAIRGFLNPTGAGQIENFIFSDGTLWQLTDVLKVLETQVPVPSPGPIPDIVGTDGNDVLVGTSGADKIDGRKGDDTLSGGAGGDIYFWSSGNDLIVDEGQDLDQVKIGFLSSDVTFTADLEAGTLFITAVTGDKLTIRNYFDWNNGHIESLIFKDRVFSLDAVKAALKLPPQTPEPQPDPSQGVHLKGTEADDTLNGGLGHDTLEGAAGNDVLVGGAGHDVLNGGTGADLLKGGQGDDTYLWGRGLGEDLIFDLGGNDTLRIDALSSEVTFARDASDPTTLAITLDGQVLKLNYYFVTKDNGDEESHIEKLVFSDGSEWGLAKVLAALETKPDPDPQPDPTPDPEPEPEPEPDPQPDTDGDIIVGQKGHDVLWGTDLDDTINGGSGNDTLLGGAGDDILMGGKGKDALAGGAGEDFFVFTKPDLGKERDVIVDFQVGVDLIDLSKIDAKTSTRKNDAFKTLLFGNEKFTAAGQLRYNAKTGILSVNTDKDAAAEFQLLLKNKPKGLSLDDFVL